MDNNRFITVAARNAGLQVEPGQVRELHYVKHNGVRFDPLNSLADAWAMVEAYPGNVQITTCGALLLVTVQPRDDNGRMGEYGAISTEPAALCKAIVTAFFRVENP